jgi:tetratricopeptide (TPR) repeat protein
MPLGILLAATWVEMLPPEEIADEIADQFPGHGLDFLQSDLRDLPERQRSMRAVFDHSWRLLTQREQEAFQGLSVFRSGFARQAAQQVTGVSAHGLMALATKSLLQRTPTGRYEMHELLRQYAAEKLGQSRGGGEAVRGRHCDYYTSSLKVWAADLKGAQQQAALAEIECEIENVHVAWDWAVERVPEQVECLDRSLDGLCMFYQMRGRLQEGEAACQKVATGLRDGESAAEMRAQARALAWQSTFSRLFGHIEPAYRLARRALKLLSELQAVGHDVRREEAFALRVKGVAEVALGEREEARRSWQKSLALCRALDDRWEEANVRDRLGWVATTSCLYDKAERQFEKSLEIRRALGDARGIAESLISLGSISWRLGRLERAERMHREAITIREEIGDRIMVARGYHYLGLVYAVAGRQADRCPLEERALAIHDEVGYPLGRLESLISLGYTKQHLGEYREAHTYFQTSLAVAREMSNRRMMLSILEALGELELAQEAYAEAVPLLQESLAIRREIGFRQDEMLLLIGLGCALRGLGDHRQMRRHIRAALRIATELSAWVSLVPAVCAIALLLADRGESARAIELYALALRYPRIANSRWWDDVVGKHIAAAAATLPPDVVTAAQERGRARELDATMKELLVELEQEGKP